MKMGKTTLKEFLGSLTNEDLEWIRLKNEKEDKMVLCVKLPESLFPLEKLFSGRITFKRSERAEEFEEVYQLMAAKCRTVTNL